MLQQDSLFEWRNILNNCLLGLEINKNLNENTKNKVIDLLIKSELIPAVKQLIDTFIRLEEENEGIVKSGRTHLQDATPIKFSQEISGWRSSLEKDVELLTRSIPALYELALGGTAVGTGLNAPKGFDTKVAEVVAH